MEKATYVTQEGLDKLKSELEWLKTTKRKDIASRIASAKELGDLSENAEYSDAKEEQALMETRVLELEDTLRRVQVIQKTVGSKTVIIGSHIVVLDETGKKREFDIVGSNEANPLEGKISNESPLGKAFLGHKVDDAVKVTVPKGIMNYTISKIS